MVEGTSKKNIKSSIELDSDECDFVKGERVLVHLSSSARFKETISIQGVRFTREVHEIEGTVVKSSERYLHLKEVVCHFLDYGDDEFGNAFPLTRVAKYSVSHDFVIWAKTIPLLDMAEIKIKK